MSDYRDTLTRCFSVHHYVRCLFRSISDRDAVLSVVDDERLRVGLNDEAEVRRRILAHLVDATPPVTRNESVRSLTASVATEEFIERCWIVYC